MTINRAAICGSLESNDIMISIKPSERETAIHLESIVKQQYGEAIEAVILDTLRELGVSNVLVDAHDRGAVDCTIRARVETAVLRAAQEVG